MRQYFNKVYGLAFSSTAKDTYVLFAGNTFSAFLGFVYTLFIARALTVSDFGIFSAATNLVVILTSLTDLGISTGVVNFVSEKLAQGDKLLANKYIKASTVIRLGITAGASFVVIIFAKFVSTKLIASDNVLIAVWTALITLSLALPMILPFVLQARKNFLASVIADNSLYLSRLIFMFIFMYLFGLTVDNTLISFILGGIAGSIACVTLLRPEFLFTKPETEIYKNLFKFSGWLGVNRIISSISGRLDIQMLVILAGASVTGLYSIPSRLAGFVVMLTSSFSGVLASRLAGFMNKDEEKKYILKASLALIPIILSLIFWIIIAEPFIVLLFGEKYLPAVPVFQALTASMIPFVFTAVSVTAIIYAIKRTIYIGAFSFFQLAAIFLLNLVFIPKYGIYGPTLTYGIINTILAIYTWIIVIRHYWLNKKV